MTAPAVGTRPPRPPLSGRVKRAEPESAASPRIVGRGSHAYKLPSPSLLRPPDDTEGIDEDELKDRAARLTAKFSEFGVTGTITQIHPGPVVTTYEFKPEAGIKYSRITNLVDDLCLAMKAESILIDRMPGKSTVGIEVPNLHREIIQLREAIESAEFADVALEAVTLPGQNHHRKDQDRGPRSNAAPADRGFDRLGQERGAQFHDCVHFVQVEPERSEADHDRSQAPGAGALRGHAAPDDAHRHRTQAGRQRASPRHLRDGRTLEETGRARRAQHRAIQQKLRA